MRTYSQNSEDLTIYSYFKGKSGTLLEIGANNGKDLSNSLLLIEQGWSAQLIEPGSVYTDLVYLHKDNPRVECHPIAIGLTNGHVVLHESGAHVPNGKDWGLVSSLIPEETERWREKGVPFIEHHVDMWDFKTFWDYVGEQKFDFISMDVEGLEWDILQQIDLNAVGCDAICIEWNGVFERKVQFEQYIIPFGFKLIERNRENLIFIR